MSKKAIFVGELIGKKIKIVESTQPDLVGLEGVVVDETFNMIFLKDRVTIKKIIRKTISYSLYETIKNETN